MITAREISTLISICIEVLMGIFFLSHMLPSREVPFQRGSRILFVFLYVCAMFWQELFAQNYISDTYLLFLALHLGFLICFALLFCNGSYSLRLFLPLIFVSLLTMAKQPASLIIGILPNSAQTFANHFPFINYLGILIMIPILLFLFHFKITAYSNYPFSYYLTMFAVPLLNMCIITMLKDFASVITNANLIGCFSLAIELLVYYMIYQSTAEYEERLQIQLIQQQQSYEKQRMEQLKDIVADYHQLRHDMKNHFVCMDRLLSQGHYKELRDYFYTMSKEIYALDDQIETGNEIVNQVVNIKYANAHQKNIPMEFSANIPHELHIPDYLLCSLLSNLLDNAIEASEKVKNPSVQVEMKMVKDYFSLTVRNRIESWQEQTALTHETTKNDSNFHGIGLKSVQSIVHRYNGISTFKVEGNVYLASVMLELP